jgi:hypothetical protein
VTFCFCFFFLRSEERREERRQERSLFLFGSDSISSTTTAVAFRFRRALPLSCVSLSFLQWRLSLSRARLSFFSSLEAQKRENQNGWLVFSIRSIVGGVDITPVFFFFFFFFVV